MICMFRKPEVQTWYMHQFNSIHIYYDLKKMCAFDDSELYKNINLMRRTNN